MKRALLFALALTLPLPAWAKPGAPKGALPATPVGVAVRQFVDALNSLSKAALEKFHTDRTDDDARLCDPTHCLPGRTPVRAGQ